MDHGRGGSKVSYCVLRFANVNASPESLIYAYTRHYNEWGIFSGPERERAWPDNANGRGLKVALKAQHVVYAIFDGQRQMANGKCCQSPGYQQGYGGVSKLGNQSLIKAR